MEETKQEQEHRIEYLWKKERNQQFTEDGRNAEITVDQVLQARAKVSENKVNGPEDAIVSEMIKRLPMEKIYTITGCVQKRFHGHDGVSKLVEGGEAGVLEEAGIRSYRAIALTSVMSKWCASCMHPAAFGKESAYWWIGWDKLPTLASDGDECDT